MGCSSNFFLLHKKTQAETKISPDRLLVNDTGHFSALADAVLYNAIAWAFEGKPSSIYSQTVGKYSLLNPPNILTEFELGSSTPGLSTQTQG